MDDERDGLAGDELEREGGEALPDRELMSILPVAGDPPLEPQPEPELVETPPIVEEQPPES